MNILYKDRSTSDQTTFGRVLPILDTGLEEAEALKRKKLQALKPKVVWYKNPKNIALLMLGLVALLVGLGVVVNYLQPERDVDSMSKITPTPIKSANNQDFSSQIRSKIEELKKIDFQEANLAFPQVDRDIYINVQQ